MSRNKEGKRKQRGVPQPVASKKRQKRSSDYYEDDASDPDEEKHSNRYDKVENYEYEMPSDFEDEEIDEDLAFTAEDKVKYGSWFDEEPEGGERDEDLHSLDSQEGEDLDASGEDEEDEEGVPPGWDDEEEEQPEGLLQGTDSEEQQQNSDDLGLDDEDGDADEGEEEDEEAYRGMLEAALGPRAGSKQPRKQARQQLVVTEAYPESQHYAAAVAGAEGELQLADLLEGLGEQKAKLGSARKLLDKMGRSAAPVSAPLPRQVAERVSRKAGYESASKEVSKWQPLVKANREAPTLRFTSAASEVPRVAGSTAALVAAHTPDNDMEEEVAALLAAAGASSAAAMAEAEEQLAVKALSLEEARERQARLAKMRNLMFYAEVKAKRLAKIKSKEYRRHANKAAKRAAAKAAAQGGGGDADAEKAAREAAEEAEFERAKERLTLKHKNTSKWARRALKRGVQVMDDGTKAALAEQLALGAQLRRRMEGKGSGSEGEEDDSTSASEPEGEGADGAAAGGGWSKKSQKEALAIMQGLADPSAHLDGEGEGQKGLFALPFMQRALQKQRLAAAEAAAALLADAEGGDAAAAAAAAAAGGDAQQGAAAAGGRRQFGGTQQQRQLRGAAAEELDAAGSSDEDVEEDAEAKAERLGRVISGQQATTSAPAAAAARRQADGRSNHQQQQQEVVQQGAGLQPINLVTRTSGFVDIDLPDAAAAAGEGGAARQTPGKPSAPAAAAAGGKGGAGRSIAALEGSREGAEWLFAGPDGTAAASPSGRPAFIPARTFAGAKEGYVFKRGKQGVGYYQDAGPPLSGKAARQAAKQKQQKQQQGTPTVLVNQGGDGSDGEEGAAHPEQQQQQAILANGRSSKGQQQQQQQRPGVGGDASDAEDARPEMQAAATNAELQRRLLQQAFAGDDVAAEFAAEKAAEVAAELPPVEAPSALPGWGSWAGNQKEPAWMMAARRKAEKAQAAAAAARTDAKLQNVILSEKWDKKAAKYLAPQLPFPYNNPVVYETSIRQALGRETNTDAAFRNLTRPAVLKDTGVVIEPIRFSKAVADSARQKEGVGRAVVTVAGGMVKEGQVKGTGAGGLGKGLPKKAKQARKQR